MIEVQLEAIGRDGAVLATAYGTSTTKAAAQREAWQGLSSRFASEPELERDMRDLRVVIL